MKQNAANTGPLQLSFEAFLADLKQAEQTNLTTKPEPEKKPKEEPPYLFYVPLKFRV